MKYRITTALNIMATCPVDINIKDPEGNIITKNLNQVKDATYIEFGYIHEKDPDDIVTILNPLSGNYNIEIVPEPGSSQDDTYSLYVSRFKSGVRTDQVLSEDEPIGQGNPKHPRPRGRFPIQFAPYPRMNSLLVEFDKEREKAGDQTFEQSHKLVVNMGSILVHMD